MRALRVGVVLGLLLVASACGSDDSVDTSTASSTPAVATTDATEPPPEPAPTAPATTAVTTTAPFETTEPTPTMVDVKVYYLRGERLAIAHRQVAAPAVLSGALTAVLVGPTPDERAAGVSTEIPPGTTLRDVSLADGQAIVDLSGDYESGGGALSMTARLAQVIFERDPVRQHRSGPVPAGRRTGAVLRW